MLKSFYLQRNVDHSGNSGTGKVAQVFELENLGAILIWSGNSNPLNVSSIVIYNSVDDLIKVHGHNGDTVLVAQDLESVENLEECLDLIDKSQDIFIPIANEMFELENDEEE